MRKRSQGLFDTKLTLKATVADCQRWCGSEEYKQEIVILIRDRFSERFLRPVQGRTERSGFVMMAIACFMIETLQCFKLGLISSHEPDLINIIKERRGYSNSVAKRVLTRYKQMLLRHQENYSLQKLVFSKFFIGNPNFDGPEEIDGLEFYDSVRNGLLHQSETKNGWKITRENNRDLPFFWIDEESGHPFIHADRFLERLESYLCHYCTELTNAPWNSSLWVNCRKKLGYICDNCESPHQPPATGATAVAADD